MDWTKGFALLNAPCPGYPEWVHLPCLVEAGVWRLPVDGEHGIELKCPRCGQDVVLTLEDWYGAVEEAVRRLQSFEKGEEGRTPEPRETP